MEEDRTLSYRVDPETAQQIISGLGEQHLDVVVGQAQGEVRRGGGAQRPPRGIPRVGAQKCKAQGRHKNRPAATASSAMWIEFEPLRQ